MNTLRRTAAIAHLLGLELLLALAIMALGAQLAWPAARDWWCRPAPGAIGIGRFDADSALAAEYLLYLPEHGEAPWPLVVFLHGSGQRGTNPNVLREWGPFLYLKHTSLPAIVASPQCLPTHQWEPAAVMQFVDLLSEQYQVERKRIYVVGCSMGGYGAWRVAAAYPTRFAAIAPICGGGQPEDAEVLADLPIWAFHGDKDEVVPVTESERMVEAVRAAGGTPKLTVLPGAGHGICHAVCTRADLWRWLLRQRASGGRTSIANEAPP